MSDQKQSKEITRREFLGNIVKALAFAGISGGLAATFHNRRLFPKPGKAESIGSFAISGTESEMAAVRGLDGAASARAAIAELGGIKRFVKAGDRVLIKPNCAFDRPPHLGATSSPEVVRAVVELCVSEGAEVRVVDNPINNPEGCFIKSGVGDAVQQAGGQLWLPRHDMFRTMRVGQVRIKEWEALYKPLAWADRVIGIPTVKTHNLCGATLSMKNWYGLIGEGRNKFHQAIHEVVADLGSFITPTLVVMDGTRMLMRNGPTGGSPDDVAPGNIVVAGTDQVAIDAFGCSLLGLVPADIEYLQKAETLGVGSPDWKNLRVFKETTV